jgi:hypothetical protein
MENKDIVYGDIAVPTGAQKLIELMNKYSGRK